MYKNAAKEELDALADLISRELGGVLISTEPNILNYSNL